jgi:hypothetical protein
MERGLMWLPLLALFIGLAWAGWNEYQKLEAYNVWAAGFERAKYDIYAVLGQQGDRLTWGKPTRHGPIELQEIAIADIDRITVQNGSDELTADQWLTHADDGAIAQAKRQVQLRLYPLGTAAPWTVPFTDLSLALQWGRYLHRHRQSLGANAVIDP